MDEGNAGSTHLLTSNSSLVVDNKTWQKMITKHAGQMSPDEVIRIAACGGTDLNDFMNGKFGSRKKFADWVDRSEEQIEREHP